jgi:hypothetical protein
MPLRYETSMVWARGVCCSYNEAGVALLRPLAPGEPTWPELLSAAEQQKAAEASAAAALAAATEVCVEACMVLISC